MNFVRVSLVLATLAFVGCGSGPAPIAVEAPAEASGSEAAKAILNGIAETGEVGSASEELRTSLESMGKSELLGDVDALESAASPDAAKAKAKEILGKL